MYRGDVLLRNSEGQIIWSSTESGKRVLITVEEPASPPNSDGFVVRGTVQRDGAPAANLLVRAFDKDMRSEQLLGTTRTQTDGRYEIHYVASEFASNEFGTADLLIRAYRPEDEFLLGASAILFNAPAIATIDLRLSAPAQLSEFDNLKRVVDAVRMQVAISDLTDDDITFLTGDLQQPRALLEMLRRAAQLSQQHHVSIEAFFGWGRQGVAPLTLENVLSLTSADLRTKLLGAISGNILGTFRASPQLDT